MPTPKISFGILPSLLTVILLLTFISASWQMLKQAPAERHQVTEVQVTLTAQEQPVVLGYQELGQNPSSGRSAEKDHLHLRRDASGGWWASNVADHRKIDAPTAKHETRYLKRWRLATGDRIRIKSALVEVVTVQGETLTLRESGREARWENGQLMTSEPAAAACPTEGSAFWRRWFKPADQALFLFSLGGSVPCPQRWPLSGVPVRGLEILWWDGAFWLAPGTADAAMVRTGQPLNAAQSFKNLEVQLDDAADPTRALILGRTRYQLIRKDHTLRLIPSQKADLWLKADWDEFQSKPRDARVVTVTTPLPPPTQPGGLGNWLQSHPLGAGSGFVLALVAIVLGFKALSRGNHRPFRHLRVAVQALALLMLTLTIATAWPPDPSPIWLLLSLGLAWITASGWLLITKRLNGTVGWLWVGTLGLVGCGSLILGQLGLGGDNSRWLDFTLGHWRVMAISGWLITLLALIPAERWRQWTVVALDPWTQKRLWLQATVVAVAMLVLGLQLLLGGEEGIWGIQPVEGIKAVLVLMLAHAGARIQRRRASLGQAYRLHPFQTLLQMSSFILFIVLLAGISLWAVRDLSPLLMITFVVLLWLWHIAPHPTENQFNLWVLLGRWGIPALGILLVLMMVWIGQAPERLPHWIPQYDRFMVWADPAHFRESGFQIWRALELVTAGGWSGAASSPFGWNGAVMRLPVIQNDFMGAFVLYRFGIFGGWVVLLFQTLLATALLTLSHRVAEWGREQDASEQGTSAFLSLALLAMTSLFVMHWAIAWGNTLGLLPVMGQPMTFISAANSHHLFFALPGLLLALVSAWVIQPDDES